MTLYFAFDPPEEPLDSLEDMGWPEATVSLYDTELESPYDIPNAKAKIAKAIESLPEDPHTYKKRKYWVRIEYYPLVETGEVIRPEVE